MRELLANGERGVSLAVDNSEEKRASTAARYERKIAERLHPLRWIHACRGGTQGKNGIATSIGTCSDGAKATEEGNQLGALMSRYGRLAAIGPCRSRLTGAHKSDGAV